MSRVTFTGVLIRIVWPLFLLILFLSIGLNAFFLTVERYRQGTVVQSSSSVASVVQHSLARGPKAFGVLALGLKPTKQNIDAAVKPIALYQLSGTGLSALPANIPVYRDQGTALDSGSIRSVLAELGLSDQAFSLEQPLFAKSLVLKTADHTLELSIDASLRRVSLRKTDLAGVLFSSSEKKADDAESEALAKQYANALGISYANFEEPHVLSPSPDLARIVWDARFADHPLYLEDGSKAAVLAVEVNRVTRKAVGLEMSLLRSDLLSWSAYPVASPASIMQAFSTGGLLPITASLSKSGQRISLVNPQLGYVVIPATAQAPLYVLPIVVAEGQAAQTCKNCGVLDFSSFVPAVDASSVR